MNLTDEQVIKALECCFSNKSCKECPLDTNDTDISCLRTIRKEATRLCLRQKAEIEKYQHIKETVNGFWSELQKLSIFKDKDTPTLEELLEYIEQTKAEAIKEFWERLIEERLAVINLNGTTDKYAEGYQDALCYMEGQGDNLVKEMVGD